MKAIVFASALVASILVGTASGRPFINKRALVTEVVYVTDTVANVAVYVDENGEPYSTTTEVLATSVPSAAVSTTPVVAASTDNPAPAPLVPSSSAEPAQPAASLSALPSFEFTQPTNAPTSVQVEKSPASATSVSTPVSTEPTNTSSSSTSVAIEPATTPPPAPTTVEPAAPPLASSTDVPANKKGDGDSLGVGITYDPFGSGGCKTKDQVTEDFEKMKDYSVIRIYGLGCGLVPLAVQNVVKHGQKLMAGAYLNNDKNGENLTEVITTLDSAIKQYAKGDWSVVALFSVENERVNNKAMTVSAVVDSIYSARGQLRSLGYTGPVGAVETVPATVDNPAICEAADVAMVNCHAFFDTNTQAANAGAFVKSQVESVKKACNNKRVIVTESGWPHQGDANGEAVPSPANQEMALKSLRENFDHDMFLFHAFDTPWKQDWAGTFNAEQYWGIMH